MGLVTVFNTFNPGEAQLIRSMLDAASLHPFVKHELSSLSMDGYAMASGGIEVQVPDEEAAMARELITTPPQRSSSET
jgi:hypothetical protein